MEHIRAASHFLLKERFVGKEVSERVIYRGRKSCCGEFSVVSGSSAKCGRIYRKSESYARNRAEIHDILREISVYEELKPGFAGA